MSEVEPQILFGMPAIATFLGLPQAHLEARGDLPTFKVCRTVCARPDTLRMWVRLLEIRGNADRADSRPGG
jgi:hypothetical protein